MQQFRKFEFISRIFLKYIHTYSSLHLGSAEAKIGLSDKLATSTKTDGLYLNVDWINLLRMENSVWNHVKTTVMYLQNSVLSHKKGNQKL